MFRSSGLVAGFVALLGAITACQRGAEARGKPTSEDASTVRPATGTVPTTDAPVQVADMARIKGDSTAKVWMVIVSDFQCPFCKTWHDSTAAMIEKDYVATGKVRLAYVNFPLNIHPHAREAAEAAMCAGAQHKFWEFGDRLFATQEQWAGLGIATPSFDSSASQLGLDMTAWRDCMRSHVMAPMIQADYDRGVKANVNYTPTFFIGQEVIEGAAKTPAFRAALDKALAAAK